MRKEISGMKNPPHLDRCQINHGGFCSCPGGPSFTHAEIAAWNNTAPRVGEWDAPGIIGWAFKGKLGLSGPACSPDKIPDHTREEGIVVELITPGDDGLPLWALWRKHCFSFTCMQGQWRPIWTDGVATDPRLSP